MQHNKYCNSVHFLSIANLLSWIRAYLLISFIALCFSSTSAKRKVWRRVEAISEREAVLPCEVGPIDDGDHIYVVLFYINGRKEPIYSYDNRPRGLQAPDERHIIQSDSLSGRVSFSPGLIPALHIKPVYSRDEANYTCRVDFRIANSRATRLSLHVIVPPTVPFLQVNGQSLYEPILGPLSEGQTFRISCRVSGGDPLPQVIWLKGKTVLDSRFESQNIEGTMNTLTIPNLSRSFHNSQLMCEAFNNNITAPVQTSITITMNLRPIETRILRPPKQMAIGELYEISCISAGSRPSANVTWSLGNIASVIPLPSVTDHSDNSSLSTTRLKALRRYHGQRLTCMSLNHLFPDHILADSLLLNVTYPPVAALELGRGVSSTVKEGEDVYFNCMVDSNPPSYKTRWYHENSPLLHSPETGILISGHSLGLRRVSRNQAGKYVCLASNVEGDARSSPVVLHVSYAPICALSASNSKILATRLGQKLDVVCNVTSSPGHVKYSWVFNNSITSERVPGNEVFITKDGKSGVHFKARSLQDYGTLQCWAENNVGRMNKPCLYHILPAGRPDSPVNCTVSNKTYDSLAVFCYPGFDGGLTQMFHAKVYESITGKSQLNKTSYTPNFVLNGLTPGLDYLIDVSSRNPLGRSDPVRLEAFTYKMAENRMRNEKDGAVNVDSDESQHMSRESTSGIASEVVSLFLFGGVTVLVVSLIALAVILRSLLIKKRRRGEAQRGDPCLPSSELGHEETTTSVKLLETAGRKEQQRQMVVKTNLHTFCENAL